MDTEEMHDVSWFDLKRRAAAGEADESKRTAAAGSIAIAHHLIKAWVAGEVSWDPESGDAHWTPPTRVLKSWYLPKAPNHDRPPFALLWDRSPPSLQSASCRRSLVPEGFTRRVFHAGIGSQARHIAVRANGDVFVTRRGGELVALRDTNGDG